MAVLAGIHPAREALVAGHPLEKVLVAKGASGSRIQEIIDLCRQQGIPIQFAPREALDRISLNSPHQGVVALSSAQKYAELSSVLSSELLVILDGVEDPHNLGAIARTAHAAGAGGILIPERRAAGITDTVMKAASGALEHLPVVRVGNVSRTLEELKKSGFWIYGLDERGENLHDRTDYAVPTVLVLGGEGHGLHAHVREHCDFLVRIAMAGKIASLNVSVAAGVVMFEWRRRRAT